MQSHRPERYTPSDVHYVCLYLLHSELEFVSTIDVTPKRDARPLPAMLGYRFKRSDGMFINYFCSVQDYRKIDELQKYCDLVPWTNGYLNLIQKKIISQHDITIAPLLQVYDGRTHFNTLVFHTDHELNARVYLIEPRSTNLFYSIELLYPVHEITHFLLQPTSHPPNVKSIEVENINVGHQSFLDDSTCGAHHINYVQSIMHVQLSQLMDKKKFSEYVDHCELKERGNDRYLIKFVADHKMLCESLSVDTLKELITVYTHPERAEPSTPVKSSTDELEDDLVTLCTHESEAPLVTALRLEQNQYKLDPIFKELANRTIANASHALPSLSDINTGDTLGVKSNIINPESEHTLLTQVLLNCLVKADCKSIRSLQTISHHHATLFSSPFSSRLVPIEEREVEIESNEDEDNLLLEDFILLDINTKSPRP